MVSLLPPAKCHSEPSVDCFVQVLENKAYRWFQKFLEGVRRSRKEGKGGGHYWEDRQLSQPVPCPGRSLKLGWVAGWLDLSLLPSS